MSVIKKNIIANFAGSIWAILMGLVFIPLYIKFMGIESWGLVGIFTTLQTMLGILDMGLSSTLNREMARLSALMDKAKEMRNTIRSLEVVYWGLTLFVGIITVSLSPFIAHHWIKPGHLSVDTVQQALLIMGFVIAIQMPIGFYSGGLIGLQRQVLLNVINSIMSTLRGIGSVLILWLISPTIQAFFLWQIIISILNVLVLAFFLWRKVPFNENKIVFEKKLLKGIWKFAAGMSGISILALVLTQLDKVILSKMLTLERFGYYMLASMVAMSLARLYSPVFYSIYPRLTQLAAMNDQERIKEFYHKSCQFMAVLILPLAIVIALFSYEIILLWTHNPETAQRTHLLVTILICGTAINGLMNPPYALQLAFGWTKLPFLKTLIAVIVLVPLIIYLTVQYGAIGASIAWFILNLGTVIFEIPIMHRRLLPTEKWRWYLQDVLLPVVVSGTVAGICRLFITSLFSEFMLLLLIVSTLLLTLGATVMTTTATRIWLLGKLSRVKFAF